MVDQTEGNTTQVGSTSGLAAKAREGVKLVRRLDSIFSYQFHNDPVHFAEWKSVSHIESGPVREEDDGEEAPPGGGASLTSVAPAGSVAVGIASPDAVTMVEPRVNGTAR